MESKVFVKLIHTIIERTSMRSRFVSDQLFYRLFLSYNFEFYLRSNFHLCYFTTLLSLGAIFLLGMAVNEQKRANSQGHEFNFIKMATKEGIFEKLERMMNKSEVESHSDFLWWLITVINFLMIYFTLCFYVEL